MQSYISKTKNDECNDFMKETRVFMGFFPNGIVDTEDQVKILEKLTNLATQVPHDLEAEQHCVRPYKCASNGDRVCSFSL